MKLQWIMALLLVVGGLVGCSTLSREKCETANWHELGVRHGKAGKASSKFSEVAKACGKHQITPDEAAYFKGRREGLVIYCQAENAYRAGRAGDSYEGVCPIEAEKSFLVEYERGHEIYRLERDLSSARSRIQQLEAQLNRKKQK